MLMVSYYPTNTGFSYKPRLIRPGTSFIPTTAYHRCAAHLLQTGTHAWLNHKHPRSTSFPAHPCTGTHQGQNLVQKAASSSHAVCKRQQSSVSSTLPAHPVLPCSAPSTAVSHWPCRTCGCKGEAGQAGVLALALGQGEEQLLKGTVHSAVMKYIIQCRTDHIQSQLNKQPFSSGSGFCFEGAQWWPQHQLWGTEKFSFKPSWSSWATQGCRKVFGGNHEFRCRERPSELFLILQLDSHHHKCRDPSSAPSASTKKSAAHSTAALPAHEEQQLRTARTRTNIFLILRCLHMLQEIIEMWMFEGYASLLQLWAYPSLLLDDVFQLHQTTASPSSWTAEKRYVTFCQKTFSTENTYWLFLLELLLVVPTRCYFVHCY